MKNVVLAALAVVGGIALSGCSTTKSENVRSQGVYAVNDVSATGGVATCTTTLQVGGDSGTFLDLSGTDALYCDGVKMDKNQEAITNRILYKATVPYHPRHTYKIEFVRDNESMSATAMLPSEITNVVIVGGAQQHIGHAMTVTYNPTTYDDERTAAALILNNQHHDQSSIASAEDGSPEVGRVMFSANDTTIHRVDEGHPTNEKVSGPYNGQVIVSRHRGGTAYGAWSARMSATQSTTVNVTFTD